MTSLKDVQDELRSASLGNRDKTSKSVPLAPQRIDALLSRGKAIYGSDNRAEAESAADVPKEVVRAVCVLVETTQLQPAPGGYAFQTESFGARYNLCPGQKFREQPLLGYGSGFLIAPDVIATAGHCIDSSDLSTFSAIFDFEVRGGDISLTRSSKDVYFAVEALKVTVASDGTDYAIVKLDRPVQNVEPLRVRAQEVAKGDSVYVVGHPVGLPKKVAAGARVLDTTPTPYFLANLDTFGGNSGSPVLTADNLVCGILVRGAEDFVWKGECLVAATFPLNTPGESVCRASAWRNFIPSNKLTRLRNVDGGEGVAAATSAPAPVRGACRRGLEDFLCSAFASEELRRMARHNLFLDPLVNAVNWNASLGSVAAQMVELLEERGLIGGDLFRILKAARPMRVAEIEKIEADCAGAKPGRAEPPAATAPPPVTAIDRRKVYQALIQLAPNDFNVMLDTEVDQQARLDVGGRAGQREAARILLNHYDVPYRGLDQLVSAIRAVAPGVI